MTVTISNRNFPELHRAFCEVHHQRASFNLIDHFATWLPKAEKGLGNLRRRSVADWKEFCSGVDMAKGQAVKEAYPDLRGAWMIVDWVADLEFDDIEPVTEEKPTAPKGFPKKKRRYRARRRSPFSSAIAGI